MEPEPPGAAFFGLEPEPTQVGQTRSRLWDLGDLEPELPKKVAAPQHWKIPYSRSPVECSSASIGRVMTLFCEAYEKGQAKTTFAFASIYVVLYSMLGVIPGAFDNTVPLGDSRCMRWRWRSRKDDRCLSLCI